MTKHTESDILFERALFAPKSSAAWEDASPETRAAWEVFAANVVANAGEPEWMAEQRAQTVWALGAVAIGNPAVAMATWNGPHMAGWRNAGSGRARLSQAELRHTATGRRWS